MIFDMDGTLWDAVDSYCEIWNRTVEELHLDVPPVRRADLAPLMGVPLEGIYERLIGSACDINVFMPLLEANSAKMMPVLGGRLYPGVYDTLERLSRVTRLFVVTNSEATTLPAFLETTGLGRLMTESLCYGATNCQKDVNIKHLVDKYSLHSPVYVGDTSGDCRYSHLAGVPFVWAAYGFGHDVEDYDYKLTDFTDLIALCRQ